MVKWSEASIVKVNKLEGLEGNLIKVFFSSEDFGEIFYTVPKDYLELFPLGKRYIGIYESSGLPDFLGERDVIENVCTISTSLRRIFDCDKCVYDFFKI